MKHLIEYHRVRSTDYALGKCFVVLLHGFVLANVTHNIHAYFTGGSGAMCWLPSADGWSNHEEYG